jgi:prepilin-type N-terminal cleavage/methylation domain-containing protein
MNRKGFTLIELMIVIAIIAIIAAIAIPGILAATRAANERNASGSLKQMGSVEVTFKTSDSDQNALNDYWTADVAGLYHIQPTNSAVSIRMIELAVALADGNVDTTAIDNAGAAVPSTHLSSPKAGYWFQAQIDYQNDGATTVTAYGVNHTDRFSFIAYPNSYGSSGKLIFILSEGGTMYKRDGINDTTYRDANQPVTGVSNTQAQLTDLYNTFPANPVGPATTGVAGPWSKMD